MNIIKNVLATTGSSLVLALSVAGVAAADATSTNNCTGGTRAGGTDCTAVSVDRSLNVSGNCSGIIQTTVVQSNGSVDQDSGGQGNGGFLNGSTNTSTTTNTSTQSNSASVVFSPNCSTTNVTQVAAASTTTGGQGGGTAAAQVQAPAGAVHAGAGGGLSKASSATSLAGLTGSVGALGMGLAIRKRALGL